MNMIVDSMYYRRGVCNFLWEQRIVCIDGGEDVISLKMFIRT
jgi:hypothetical protein